LLCRLLVLPFFVYVRATLVTIKRRLLNFSMALL